MCLEAKDMAEDAFQSAWNKYDHDIDIILYARTSYGIMEDDWKFTIRIWIEGKCDCEGVSGRMETDTDAWPEIFCPILSECAEQFEEDTKIRVEFHY